MKKAYYNEINPYAAQWLRNLIVAGHITPGDVDERDIRDVKPSDLRDYTQCHFFAGIGVWSYALRKSGWHDNDNVWTGSCPCQPFSAAGKGGGFDDERHLWPQFHYLIKQCRPDVILSEQVASKNGLGWLDLVQSDMEGTDYAFGAVDSCSAGFGAPHIRQRLYWMATNERFCRCFDESCGDSASIGPNEIAGKGTITYRLHTNFRTTSVAVDAATRVSPTSELGNTIAAGLQERIRHAGISGGTCGDGAREAALGAGVHVGGVEQHSSIRREWREATAPGHDNDGKTSERTQNQHGPSVAGAHWVHPYTAGPTNGFWRDADWLICRDGKWRPVEPGTFPLAHGAASRVGRLRAYGNAINAEQAIAFCEVVALARRPANDNAANTVAA